HTRFSRDWSSDVCSSDLGDEVEIEMTLEPLLHDLEMEQPQEAAAEAETECGRRLRLVLEARVVEAQLGQAVAQILVICRVDRKRSEERRVGTERGARCAR